jgi:predicted O-methyltransferase YrrM
MAKFHITSIRPPGFLHTSGFAEIIDGLSWSLSALGHSVVIAENTFSQDGTNVLFGAELLSKEQQLPQNVIIYNLEQGAAHPAWENIKRLAKGKTVWDYNRKNVEEWRRLGYDCQHVPFGFTPNLVRIPNTEDQTTDVFFSGFPTPRRVKVFEEIRSLGLNLVTVDSVYGGARDLQIARAKVVLNVCHDGRTLFNAQRVSFLMANSKCVVSEISEDDADYADLDNGLVRVPYDKLAEACDDMVRKANFRGSLEYMAFDAFSRRDYTSYVAKALESQPKTNPVLERYERGCREGDMKEYLPWLRANAKGNILEIGVRDGASTSALLLGVEKNGGCLISLDIVDCRLWQHPQWTFFNRSRALYILPKEPYYDMALIDGDHSRAGFLSDLHACYREVKNGGMIAVHDTHPPKTYEEFGGDWPSVAVGQEFDKFCKERGLTNFTLPGVQGMGVLVVKK